MYKSDAYSLSSSQATPAKNHFLAWDREYAHLKWGGPAPVRDIQAHLLPGSRVLDAGSGNGRYLGELARHYDAIGIDVSLTALKASRAQIVRISGQMCQNFHSKPMLLTEFSVMECSSTSSKKKENPQSGSFITYSGKAGLFYLKPSAVRICAAGVKFQPLMRKGLLPDKVV